MDGFWQSDGYGFVLEITGPSARLYSTGEQACVRETDELVPLDDLLPGIAFEASADGQHLNILLPMEPHRIGTFRLHELLAVCMNQTAADPKEVFDAFVGYFDANYPFFPLYDFDWPRRVEAARQRVNARMGDRGLFDVLDWLIHPLRDGHVSLVAEIDGTRYISVPGRANILKQIWQTASDSGTDPAEALSAFRHAIWFNSIQSDILHGRGHITGNDRIQYGMLTDEVGYLSFAAVGGFGPADAAPSDQLDAAQALLDHIMSFFETQEPRSIVLDLSLNLGGDDYIAREIASRFIEQCVISYTKYAGDADKPIMTRVDVEPSKGDRFDGTVFLLTSQITVSAAEVLVLLLKEQPHVVHAGERTRGALSDALTRSLPNGWQLSMSNEVYLDADGQAWESIGIPPDLAVPVFLKADPIYSHKSAVLEILEESAVIRASAEDPNLSLLC